MSVRIEVRGHHAAATQQILRDAATLDVQGLTDCRITQIYFLEENPGAESLQQLCTFLLADPVTETASWGIRRTPFRLMWWRLRPGRA